MRVSYDTMLAEFERVLKKYGFQAERAHDAALLGRGAYFGAL